MAKFHLKSHTQDKEFRIKGRPDTHYWFTLVANNGQTLMTSETYPNRRNAFKGMKAVVRAFASDGRILESYVDHTDGKPTEKKFA